MAQKEGSIPIVSNIKTTDNGKNDKNDNNDNDFDYDDNDFDFDDDIDAFNDQDDDEFDDQDGDNIDNNDDDDWGSLHSSNDGQIQIPIDFPNKQKNGAKPVINVGDINPFAEGNEVVVANQHKPVISMNNPKQKCWICDICHAVNNLLDSMKTYNYKCCICSYAYHPNVVIIYSNDWDGNNPNAAANNNKQDAAIDNQIYTVWICPFCTLKNDINWKKCDGCASTKPNSTGINISYTYIKPKQLNGPAKPIKYNKKNKNNNAAWNFNDYVANNNVNMGNNAFKINKDNKANKRVNRAPRIQNIGIAKSFADYPSFSNTNYEKRLVDIFGKPYQNQLLGKNKQNQWTKHINISHSRLEWASYSNDAKHFTSDECVGRGFAINSRTGWIAMMSTGYLWVFEPVGSSLFRLKARYQFNVDQKLKGEDVQNSRLRFVGDHLYVWSFARSRVYSFKLSYNSLILVDVIKDKYFKDSQTMDIAVTDNLLILLFDRWCGIYKLYPKFEWYHAVAFAAKAVNCFSFEINSYNYFEDRTPMKDEAFFTDSDQKDININPNDGIISNIKNKFILNSSGSGNKKKRSKRKKNKFFKNSKNDNDDDDDKKKDSDLYKPCNQNYMFINTENQLIGVHPVNLTFDFLHIANDAQHGKVKYCISSRYGVFYISNNSFKIYQSSVYEYNFNICIFDINDNDNNNNKLNKFVAIEQYHSLVLTAGIRKFSNIQYDETYGISGRLLIYCQTQKSDYFIHQMFNQNELILFRRELDKIDYILMPGMNKKFNLIIFVYQMLYGNDLIDTLLQSPLFNPALLKLKQKQKQQLNVMPGMIPGGNLQNQKSDQSVVDMDIEGM